MPINPTNADPLKDYVANNITNPLTVDGLVVNGTYAYTGVLDTIFESNKQTFSDPLFNQSNTSTLSPNFKQVQQTQWISPADFGGPDKDSGSSVTLNYVLGTPVYFNNITLSVLNVPCTVEILDGNGNLLDGAYYNIDGTGEVPPSTTSWKFISYTTSSNIGTLTEDVKLSVRITRSQSVQQYLPNATPTDIAFSVGIKNFSVKLQVQKYSDFDPQNTGNNVITLQNRFGFVENYTAQNDTVSNIWTTSSTDYWKCSPQPVADAVVYFYAQTSTLADGTPQSFNRIYLDPLYTSCRLNVYFTNDTPSGTGYNGLPAVGQKYKLGTVVDSIDNAYWTPLHADFVLKKGIYEIPDTTCTYLKFEFTKLVAEIYDLQFDSIQRVIDTYPFEVEDYYHNLEVSFLLGNSIKYSSINNKVVPNKAGNQLDISTFFGQGNSQAGSLEQWPSLGALNNSQLGGGTNPGFGTNSYVLDPSISYKLINPDGSYNQLDYTEFLTRSFYAAGVHKYEQHTVNQTWHQAYFTGLKSLALFHEVVNDDLRGTPSNFSTFQAYNITPATATPAYVTLDPDQVVYTPWFSTTDQFKSFNIAGMTTDWRSFLSDNQVLMNDDSVLGGGLFGNTTFSVLGSLGTSKIIAVGHSAQSAYGIRSVGYETGNNLVNYRDANFDPTYGVPHWTARSGAVVTSGLVNVYPTVTGGVPQSVNSLTFSGTTGAIVTYDFTIPNVFSTSGTQPWQLQFGAAGLGTVGYASYNPASGINYYFTVGATTPGSTGSATRDTNLTFKTEFVTSSGTSISGTVVSGTNVTISGSAYNVATLTGTNSIDPVTRSGAGGFTYTTGTPSNTIRLTVAASGLPATLFQLGAFTDPSQKWISPSDHSNMRVSGVARIYLPYSNNGNYRASLYATNLTTGGLTELTYKLYKAGQVPLKTWMDIQLESFTTTNYTDFYMQVQETTGLDYQFYISMLSAFYHPIRYEYNTTSGNVNTWKPIVTGVNRAGSLINIGSTTSGIQVRATSLDANVFISGVSIVPKYTQSPYYSDLNVDYMGSSKTNELESRTSISKKPYFLLNQEAYPNKFNINQIAPSVIPYKLD